MKNSRNPARTGYRAILNFVLAISAVIEVITLITHDELGNRAGWTTLLAASILLLWSHRTEDKERIAELERRENLRFEADSARNARLVELMDSAWRNDPVYREQRQKREAQEKYLRQLLNDKAST